jgi:hypothetical protein
MEEKMKKAIAFLLVSMFVFAAAASAEVEAKFYGYQWLRYDYKYTGINPVSNGFYVPRTYLRYKVKDFDMGYECFLIVDINNDQYGQKVATTASAGAVDWGVWVKNGYLALNKIPFLQDAGMSLKIGIQPVYFGAVDTWSYPVFERALEDKLGYMYSADQGIALTGTFPESWGSYEIAVYNGSGYKKIENNMEKAYCASVLVSPTQGLYARASYYTTFTNLLIAAPQRFDTTAVVLGFKIAEYDGFFEYVVKNAAKDWGPGMSGTGEAYSVFLNYNVFSALALSFRYDVTDPDTFVRKDEMNTFIGGISCKIAGDAVLLQLNYQLDAAKFKGSDKQNANLWAAQVKWAW